MSVDPRIIASLITEDPDTFSEAGFNKSGVPYYAKNDTSAVRPRSVSGTPSDYDTEESLSIKDARQEARIIMGVARTGDMVKMRVNISDKVMRKAGLDDIFFGPGTITRISDRSVTLKPVNGKFQRVEPDETRVQPARIPGKTMVMDWFQFVELAKPIN